MKSEIKEFQGNHSKESDTIICICGPSGAGKGTLAGFISEKLGIKKLSAGDFFRQLAEEKDMTVEELSEKADKQTDIEVDRRTLQESLKQDCVVESRIAAWVLGSYADLKIYVTADLDERAHRVQENAKERTAEDEGSLEEVKQRIKKRDEDNWNRYQEYYSIDMNDSSMFDMVIDNTEMTIEEQEKLVEKALKKKQEIEV
ncbi:(d)CMP kinase [Candidatus Nanohalobium constans]|uniref:Cytidylate kinase n=1 Tax=Candidatus Nanohalobium constans TaxID=2565781 RepID=A0A5Q0UJ63_9ARCH|nr:nucleoside monophosphate kinase [Candidatus Nanohalobium constans]QGA80995.1 cytidylate kinase [Candidatus Nanohalobium constans]